MSLRNVLTAALLAVATLANATTTDHDKWVGQLQKYGVYIGSDTVPTIVDAFDKAKSACVCTEDGSLAHRPGYITFGDGVDGLITICAVPLFDERGAFEGAAGCSSFAPLVK